MLSSESQFKTAHLGQCRQSTQVLVPRQLQDCGTVDTVSDSSPVFGCMMYQKLGRSCLQVKRVDDDDVEHEPPALPASSRPPSCPQEKQERKRVGEERG